MIRGSLTRVITAVLVTLGIAAAGIVASPQATPVQALSGSSFNPGNIISDAVMFSGNAMTAPEVQAFLNARVPRCTLGDPGRPAGGIYTFADGSQTRLATSCLKDYRESVPSVGADRFCANNFTGGTYSAAEIIVLVGQACNVNPKVLIVLLEKEQSLVTDSFPAVSQYTKATGLDCPDTAPCSAASAGFFRQVFGAAHRFQNYGTSPYTWRPAVGQVQQILFNVEGTGCGASAVRVENRATAALYYYTPYQPNAAALNNLYGRGDGCSAYGNRNFWRIFNDWFGSTQEIPGSRDFITSVYNDVLGRGPEQAGLDYWIARMAAGMSRQDMANAFNNSDEYRLKKINEAYQRALKRAPEPAGTDYWMAAMRAGAISPENLYSTFIHSPEMFNVQGGGTNEGYVTALYRELLLREPEPAGLEYYVSRLQRGESRQAVTDGIWFSPEKYNVRVDEAYQQFLRRGASSPEQQFWSTIARVYGPTYMRSQLLASDEYWVQANARY